MCIEINAGLTVTLADRSRPCQICGLEKSARPLITACPSKAFAHKNFIWRRSWQLPGWNVLSILGSIRLVVWGIIVW